MIQEAQQARVPVIAADAGGMAELIRGPPGKGSFSPPPQPQTQLQDSRSGITKKQPVSAAAAEQAEAEAALLFRHRDPGSLAVVLANAAANPQLIARLGERGFTGSAPGDVRVVRVGPHGPRDQLALAVFCCALVHAGHRTLTRFFPRLLPNSHPQWYPPLMLVVQVVDIRDHAQDIMRAYYTVLAKQQQTPGRPEAQRAAQEALRQAGQRASGLVWRITFDTNPDGASWAQKKTLSLSS